MWESVVQGCPNYGNICLADIKYEDNKNLCVRVITMCSTAMFEVILMSATIDSQLFANYFSVAVGDKLSPSPILSVQGRTYKVSEFYLDHLIELADVSIVSL